MTLESLHSLAVFHKDQDSGVKVKICIFISYLVPSVFLSSIQQVYQNHLPFDSYFVLSQPQSSCLYSLTQTAEHLVLLPTFLTPHC